MLREHLRHPDVSAVLTLIHEVHESRNIHACSSDWALMYQHGTGCHAALICSCSCVSRFVRDSAWGTSWFVTFMESSACCVAMACVSLWQCPPTTAPLLRIRAPPTGPAPSTGPSCRPFPGSPPGAAAAFGTPAAPAAASSHRGHPPWCPALLQQTAQRQAACRAAVLQLGSGRRPAAAAAAARLCCVGQGAGQHIPGAGQRFAGTWQEQSQCSPSPCSGTRPYAAAAGIGRRTPGGTHGTSSSRSRWSSRGAISSSSTKLACCGRQYAAGGVSAGGCLDSVAACIDGRSCVAQMALCSTLGLM